MTYKHIKTVATTLYLLVLLGLIVESIFGNSQFLWWSLLDSPIITIVFVFGPGALIYLSYKRKLTLEKIDRWIENGRVEPAIRELKKLIDADLSDDKYSSQSIKYQIKLASLLRENGAVDYAVENAQKAIDRTYKKLDKAGKLGHVSTDFFDEAKAEIRIIQPAAYLELVRCLEREDPENKLKEKLSKGLDLVEKSQSYLDSLNAEQFKEKEEKTWNEEIKSYKVDLELEKKALNEIAKELKILDRKLSYSQN